MKDLIEEWQQNSGRKVEGNFDFLNWLKVHRNSSRVDLVANRAHTETFAQIDCTGCANCCKTISPVVSPEDIQRISLFLEMSETEFIEKYLKSENESEYEMNALPCPFLKEDKCSIYEVRPDACQEYPHTDKKGFTRRRYMHTDNTEICPAVYHILEKMKREFGWLERR